MNDDDFSHFEELYRQIGGELTEEEPPSPPCDPVADAWQCAGEWIAHRDREVRRHTRLPDAAGMTQRALVPLILYSMAACQGRPNAALVYGLTFGLEEEIIDSAVVDDDGTVNPVSLLHTVFRHLQSLPHRRRGQSDRTTPRQSAEDLLREFLELEPGPRTLLWQAIRGVTKPKTAPRMDSSGLQYQSSLDDPVAVTRPGAGQTQDEVTAQLHSLVGLDSVKRLVTNRTAALANDTERRGWGLSVPDRTRHLILTGNPGTGKTTVARLITALYHHHGLISDGLLVETDRSGLVGEYLGHSALKTNKVIEAARGGVLFIDEAYALAGDTRDGADRFAMEALATLVKAMEDYRDDLVVILAGYPDPMRRLLAVNPGLSSRIGATIDFPDYTSVELIQILQTMITDFDYTPPADLPTMVDDWLSRVPRDDTFGNARLIRTLFEEIITNHAVRMRSRATRSLADQRTLSADDIAQALQALTPEPTQRQPIGFVDHVA